VAPGGRGHPPAEKGEEMKRLWIILLVGLLAAAVAAPAAARKPETPPSPPAPALYQVTMAIQGEEGLSTTCDGPLIMRIERKGQSYAANGPVDPLVPSPEDTSVPRMDFEAGVAWSRKYPVLASGTAFTGCHGGTVPLSPERWDGALRIIMDRQGKPTGLIWHFDYYSGDEAREHFTLTGEDFKVTKTGDTFEVTDGVFEVSYYLNSLDEYVGYKTLDNPPDLRFSLTITPYLPS